MSVPNILYNVLSISETETQKDKPHTISHHCLIKLLVERSLRYVSPMYWNEFVEIRKFRVDNVGPVELLPTQKWENFENVEKTGSHIEPSSSRMSPDQNVPEAEEPLQEEASVGIPSQSLMKTRLLHKGKMVATMVPQHKTKVETVATMVPQLM